MCGTSQLYAEQRNASLARKPPRPLPRADMLSSSAAGGCGEPFVPQPFSGLAPMAGPAFQAQPSLMQLLSSAQACAHTAHHSTAAAAWAARAVPALSCLSGPARGGSTADADSLISDLMPYNLARSGLKNTPAWQSDAGPQPWPLQGDLSCSDFTSSELVSG